MSDSVDRVFVKAITTIRALSSRSSYGSLPRPPAENRIKLYGLYKQATEGDVENVMPRPIGFSLEDEGARKKWDAWKQEEGQTRTEAKRQYISYLIDTMRSYASGTHEARELLSELEYLWNQIKDLKLTPEDEEFDHNSGFHPHHINPEDPRSMVPLRSPLIQLDRYSNATPLPLGSLHLGTGGLGGGYLQQYKSNLQKIYSHSRKSTMISLNENQNYTPIQTPIQTQYKNDNVGAIGAIGGSVRGGIAGGVSRPMSVVSLPNNRARQRPTPTNVLQTATENSGLDDIRAWQSEINLVINKLSREFLNARKKKPSYQRLPTDLEETSLDYTIDERDRLRRRILGIVKFIGIKALVFLKNVVISAIAMMFVVWCIKKNVIVQRTMVQNSQQQKELVINMVLNVNENRWFIRILNFMNSFVGFV